VWRDTVIIMTLKARVNGGRLVVDEPTDLPEGTEIGCCRSIPEIASTRKTEPRSIGL
jgi:hypothetical protein